GPEGRGPERRGPERAPRPERPKLEPMRIQRAIARAGVVSRRKAEELVAAGRVLVNGEAAVIGQVVDPARDRITVDGQPLERPTEVSWILLNKPAGYLTTRHDPEGRPTVFGLVPEIPGLTYVGRLDFMTEGVLLLTTDGEAAHRLTHPSGGVERTYVATVRGNATAAARRAQRGVELEDGPVTPVRVDAAPLGNRRWAFEVVLTEGRTREVRRLCEALGLEVERLVRTQYGPFDVRGLEPGAWRELTPRERQRLKVMLRAM
ncbi:MAG TPA: pseudouridine synthase, partial [Gemmatimonadaceae bacterium]|nr:pseudouridine synthase [Gemmatimonadaceae bacterium]